ncbi:MULTISPECIES: GNAT family N-acetyltransferase [Mumia]|uniref:GNAT family N-acetyltransferase n=1 Tax=Mumia TaxID=1546255 RepID=UPI00141FDB8D|nr:MULTISPECIES: GNAT family N-acetyltransferase [unclassified Mumia]QMW66881.1 GNAT family N-acetyltransferase [Mumia sp. ZJ1417]
MSVPCAVRHARSSDIERVVALHEASFPGFFLSLLGPTFLRELYRGLLALDEGILLVAEMPDGRVIGFLGGTDDRPAFYRRLLRRRGWRFALAAVPAVVRHPSMARRVVRGRERAERGNDPGDAGVNQAPGSLMSLGVAPQAQGTGAGRELVRAFDRVVQSRGSAGYTLTTDAEDNDRVNAFYVGLGLVPASEHVTPEGRRLIEYVRVWASADPRA